MFNIVFWNKCRISTSIRLYSVERFQEVSGINNTSKCANTEPQGVVPSLLTMNDSSHGSMS